MQVLANNIQKKRYNQNSNLKVYRNNSSAKEVDSNNEKINNEIQQFVDCFLANISHEVRTPLNIIVGFASLLNSNSFSETEKQEMVESINNSSNNLTKLIDDILELSLLESKRYNISPSSFNLKDLVDEVFNNHKNLINKEIEFNIEFEIHENSLSFFSDKKSIEKILSHLIYNAIKFTNSGQINLKVFKDNNNLVFEVIDTGKGFDIENSSLIFNSFRQNKYSETTSTTGVGIGLSIAKMISELIGGEIIAKSTMNKGSSFSLILPV